MWNVMTQPGRLALLAAFGLGAGVASTATGTIFEDNFNDPVVEDADGQEGFWTTTSTSTRTWEIDDGRLTARVDERGNGGMYMSSSNPDFNLLEPGDLIYRLEGLEWDEAIEWPGGNILRSGFMGQIGQVWGLDNRGIGFQVRGDDGQYAFGWSGSDQGHVWSENELASGQLEDTEITAIEFAISASGWRFTLEHAGGEHTESGSVALPLADIAGNAEGDVYLNINPFKSETTPDTVENPFTEVSIDRVAVIPEPGSLALLSVGALVMLRRRR